MNKKGVILIYISVLFIVVILLVMSALLIPTINQYADNSFDEGKNLINQTSINAQTISNSTDKAEIINSLNSAELSTQNNKETIIQVSQYSPWIVIFITVLSVFVIARMFFQKK